MDERAEPDIALDLGSAKVDDSFVEFILAGLACEIAGIHESTCWLCDPYGVPQVVHHLALPINGFDWLASPRRLQVRGEFGLWRLQECDDLELKLGPLGPLCSDQV